MRNAQHMLQHEWVASLVY